MVNISELDGGVGLCPTPHTPQRARYLVYLIPSFVRLQLQAVLLLPIDVLLYDGLMTHTSRFRSCT